MHEIRKVPYRGTKVDATDGTSVEKALALLTAIAQRRESVRLSDLADDLCLPKSTTHRLLKSLESFGFIGRTGTKYQIGSRLFDLSEAARWSVYGNLRESAQESLAELFEHGGAAVHLAVYDNEDVLYLEKITGSGGVRVPTRVGARMPATCTSLGKVLLAFSRPSVVQVALERPLPRVTPYSIVDPNRLLQEFEKARETGVAFEYEEARLGVSCMASPVLVDGEPVAAVSLSLLNAGNGLSPARSDLVRSAAKKIAARLRAS